jgi:hypothetical protein
MYRIYILYVSVDSLVGWLVGWLVGDHLPLSDFGHYRKYLLKLL